MEKRDLDLYQKLTLVYKLGTKPKAKVSKNANNKVSKVNAEKVKQQFDKAATAYYYDVLEISPDLALAYMDFDAMDYSPEISAALDIYADESVMKNIDGEIIKVVTENERIRDELENLLYNVLDVKTNLWHWIRSTVKYGNHYILLNVNPELGIDSFIPMPINQMQREEAYDKNLNSVKFRWIDGGDTFDEWQIGHFRLLNSVNESYYPYGTSMLESARRIWKQLQLMEDAMIIYRITRAPERRVFYVDVGNIEHTKIQEYMEKIKNVLKRTPVANQKTGAVTSKFNPISVDEDFFIPRRNDKTSSIDTLPGASNLDQIADIEYLQQKLFTALKIPKAFLSYESDVNAKATLSGQDSRFSRTINRIQQSIIAELTKICITHLYSVGFTSREDLSEFSLELNSPSSQYELEQLEVYKSKAEMVTAMWNETSLSPISLVWGLRKIMGFTDDEIKEILKQQYLEGKINMQITSASDAYLKAGEESGGVAITGAPSKKAPFTAESVDSWLNEMVAKSEVFTPDRLNEVKNKFTNKAIDSINNTERLLASIEKAKEKSV